MTSRMTRRGLLAGAGAITLATPMLAPRLARAATPASFQLDWKINAQFAGLLVADDAGSTPRTTPRSRSVPGRTA